MAVGSLDELRRDRCKVVSAGGRTIFVVFDAGKVFALDNRCPHMGFTTLNVYTQVLDGAARAAIDKIGDGLFTNRAEGKR